MVNNNGIPIEVKKPFETVQELKNEIPSFEEFMKTYETDGNLNYDDLNGGDIGTSKGYGPVGEYSWQETRNGTTYTGCGQYAQRSDGSICNSRFYLTVDCLNWGGGGGYTKSLQSTSEALEYAHELERGKYFNVSSEVELKCAILIRDAIRKYERGSRVDGYIKVQGKF